MASPKLLDSLSESDLALVRETGRDELKRLDEDELLEVHARVRRARNKHLGVYRRAGAAKVSAKGARGRAHTANERNRARAEVFEKALARVSTQLAVAARKSAADLKDERLAAAAKAKAAGPGKRAASTAKAAKRASGPASKANKKQPAKSPSRKKQEAGSKAAGARRQAKRDGKRR